MSTHKITVGRHEEVVIPELDDLALHAKVDTGARSSSLHARKIKSFTRDGQEWVRFKTVDDLKFEAPVAATRKVKSSNGKTQKRYFIEVFAHFQAGTEWPLVASLADRSKMKFPLLLGRRALAKRFVVDVSRSYCRGRAETKAG